MKHRIVLYDNSDLTLIQMQQLFYKIQANMRLLKVDFYEAAQLATMKIELPKSEHVNCKCDLKLVEIGE